MDFNSTYSLLIRYADGETSAEESAQVEELLKNDIQWKKEYELLTQFNQKITDSIKINSQTDKSWENLKAGLNISLPAQKKSFWPAYTKYAAAAVIILFAGLYFLKPFISSDISNGITYQTGINETKKIKLDDGSLVILNENTSLTLDKGYNTNNRNLQLIGQAFFDVKKDPNKPFIAFIHNTKIKVLGTSFEIKAPKKNLINIKLYQGKIKFTTPQKATILKPGEQLTYTPTESKSIIKPLDIFAREAWTVSGLDFKDTPLSEIISKLEQTYSIRFQIPPAIQNERYTISFDGLDLPSSLKLLEELTDSKITKKDSIYILKS